MTDPESDDVHVIAIDWSGAARGGGAQRIWLAEVHRGQLVRLENGLDRDEIAAHLVQQEEKHPHLVVGLDFAFSFPAWFVEMHGFSTVTEAWDLASKNANAWLHCCPWPFWGHAGTTMPKYIPVFRQTEQDVKAMGLGQPKSVFQIAGAGAVGTGSLRGMPVLTRLHEAGFWIWPFAVGDAPGWPRVVEIYPRALIGAGNLASPQERLAHVSNHHPTFPATFHACVAESRDAFDAAVSALVMAQHVRQLCALGPSTDPRVLLEGSIWCP